MTTTIPDTISSTDFHFPKQTKIYKGKVRDVYTINDKLMVMIVSDRISAFDVVLPRAIPYKGAVLNQIAARMMECTKDIVPNWIVSVPDANVTIGKKCEPFRVEMVIRGYLTGHAWREYKSGKRILCGVILPEGMKENEKFPQPIITPSTKAEVGHDIDISREEIIKQGIVSEEDYTKLENYTRAIFQRGTEFAAKQNLLLVDTKYEFGFLSEAKSASVGTEGKIFLIDEIHTPDSSRYFYADTYDELLKKGEPQKQLSKEFVRQWLIENNFQGREGEKIPVMSDEWVMQISVRYIELYEKLLGEKFSVVDNTNLLSRVEKNVLNKLAEFGF